MAATTQWCESNGATPTNTEGVVQVNWKSVDDIATSIVSAPIAAGSNSYEKWQYVKFSGTFNRINNLKFAHTAGSFPTGCTLKGPPAMTADGDRLAFSTPATTANTNLTVNITTAISIGSGVAVWVGITGPASAGKAASSTANPCYTNYLTTQLQTTGSAPAGSTNTITVTLQYDEN